MADLSNIDINQAVIYSVQRPSSNLTTTGLFYQIAPEYLPPIVGPSGHAVKPTVL